MSIVAVRVQARAAPAAGADAASLAAVSPATAPQRKQPAGRSAAPGGVASKRKAKAPTRAAAPPEADDEGASEEVGAVTSRPCAVASFDAMHTA